MNEPAPARSCTALAVAALLITAAVNWHHLAWWCLPLLVLATAWHARAALRGHALPGRAARIGLALIITCGVLLSYRTLNGLSAGATLLAAMSAAKLFEARTRRDWHVLNGATLFLLLAACLDRQQLWRLPVYGLCLWLSASSLRGLGEARRFRPARCCASPRASFCTPRRWPRSCSCSFRGSPARSGHCPVTAPPSRA